jgi:5'-phosphate synthase pdxT subunit
VERTPTAVVDSFRAAGTALTGGKLEAVFIRAPRIRRLGPGVETLAHVDGEPVLVREGNILAATFHPELGGDQRVHRLFVEIVQANFESFGLSPGAASLSA